jgi:hypothetical protein
VGDDVNRCVCGVTTEQPLCAYERRTVALFTARRCVLCKEPVFDQDTERLEGRCATCRERNARLSPATRLVLKRAANVRYMRAVRAA